jgi:hypothetical protein
MDDDVEMVKAFLGVLFLSIFFIGTAVVVVWATGNLFNAMAPLGAFAVLILIAREETKSR